MMRSVQRLLCIAICVIAIGAASSDVRLTAAVMQRGAQPQALSTDEARGLLNQYCVTCHNQRSKTANLELDTKDLAHLETDTAAWEAVVRKLRTGMMPPKNSARPGRV